VAELERLAEALLDEQARVGVGRKAPAAARGLALAFRWAPRAPTTAGCTSGARRAASWSETWSCADCTGAGGAFCWAARVPPVATSADTIPPNTPHRAPVISSVLPTRCRPSPAPFDAGTGSHGRGTWLAARG